MAVDFSTWYDALAALSVTGVTNLAQPPTAADLSKANVPVMWVDTAGIDEAPLHSGGIGGEVELRARIVIVTGSQAQDSHAKRWDIAIDMVDTLNTAIKTLGYETLTYSIDLDPEFWGMFFAVVAELRAAEVGV